MTHKVIDNFLSREAFEKIQLVMLNLDTKNHIPFNWYLSRNVSDSNDKSNNNLFYMYHPFYWDFAPASEWFNELLQEMIFKLEAKSLIRVKGNLYPNTNTVQEHPPHIDLDYPNKSAVYFVNTNNGYTTLNDGTKVDSVENRILLFDSSQPHYSSTCSDKKFRVTINFNYF